MFWEGAEPAGLAVRFAVYFAGPLLGGLIMLGAALFSRRQRPESPASTWWT